jgi:hypothetical protein
VKEDDELGSSFFPCSRASVKKWKQTAQLFIVMCDLSQVRKDDNKQRNYATHHHRVIFASVKVDIKFGSSSFSCAKKWQQGTQLFIVVLVLVFCKTNEDNKIACHHPLMML